MTESNLKMIGYWMSDKKTQKLNWSEFGNVCRNHGYELVKLDLEKPFENQGPFVLFLHKLTDIIVLANQGDSKSQQLMQKLNDWISKNPKMIILDPIENVKKLLDRFISYSIIEDSKLFSGDVFIPTFTSITTTNLDEVKKLLKNSKVTYPFVCKPLLAHGSKLAHKMCVVFNENGLKDCKIPYVAQSFINHNAVLYKIYIVGDYHYFVERPSLKNFRAGNFDTIYFDSHDVSKAGSKSDLSVLDPKDVNLKIKYDPEKLTNIVYKIRKSLGMSLLGVDVVIENNTNNYAVIDLNVYPGYDGFPNFFDALIILIEDMLSINCELESNFKSVNCLFVRENDIDSGFDTADSCEDKVRQKRNSIKSLSDVS